MGKVTEFRGPVSTAGFDETDFMYLTGKTLKAFAENCGFSLPTDRDGNEILDDELYCLAKRGVWIVK